MRNPRIVCAAICGTASLIVGSVGQAEPREGSEDRPTPYHQTVNTNGAGVSSFTIPTGCRLVVQAVSFSASDGITVPPHAPIVRVTTPGAASFAEYPIDIHQVTTRVPGNFYLSTTTTGTLVIQLFVDYTDQLFAQDPNAPSSAQFSVSGYLLPLTRDASC